MKEAKNIKDYDDYEYFCTERQPNDIDDTVCGKAIRIGYNLFLCGDKKGRYCADYCSEKCGAAQKREYQLSLFEGDEEK